MYLIQSLPALRPPLTPVVQVALTVHVAMTAYQSVVYDWVKATGTLRLSPFDPRIGKSHRHNFAPLNNKCMELRKVCNHPALSYPPDYGADQAELLRQCGKLCVLDRLLIKLHRTGHRVLLFSTMTRLLDLLEGYLRWRRFGAEGAEAMQYARIDGGTALEDR
jgi:SWI/SNF-related matrix-associated actin-dependent regulator of chromatin subfamily A protein 2/4